MSVISTQTFLLTLNSRGNAFLKQLILSGIQFEFLPPSKLDSQWSKVVMSQQNAIGVESNTKQNLDLLDSILVQSHPKGMFSFLEDTRWSGEAKEMEEALTKKDWLLQLARILNKRQSLENTITAVKQAIRLHKDDFILFTRGDLSEFISSFKKYATAVTTEFSAHNDTLAVDYQDFDLKFEKIPDSNLSMLILSEDTLSAVKEFSIRQSNIEFTTPQKTLEQEKERLKKVQDALRESGINRKVPSDILKQFAALHAALEIDAQTYLLNKYTFSMDERELAKFCFVAVKNTQLVQFENLLNQYQIANEQVDWTEEIVDWKTKGYLPSFQSVAQAIGTISKKESDPTLILAILFMTYFAICLGDAVYGGIVALFTGYFLLFKRIKPSMKNMLGLLFFSSLATILVGILTNSWLGDLFNSNLAKSLLGVEKVPTTSTFINDFLANFQLIDVLNAKSSALINQAFPGTSPILLMLIFAAIIGFISLLLTYLLNINTGFKSNDYTEVFNYLAWLFFIFSVIFAIVTNSIEGELTMVSQILLIASTISIFIFNRAKGFGKLLGGALGPNGLYGMISFGADIMSFTRIVAIFLTGSVIASIVNLLAGITYDSAGPIFGLILAIVVLVIGHVFNFVLSLFSAYINPLRLTYVEFMPKFFRGEAKQISSQIGEFTHFEVVD